MAPAIERFFAWIRAHRTGAWTFLFVYAAVVTFPHEQVQTLVGKMALAMGRPALYRMAGSIALALGLVASAAVVRRLRGQTMLAGYWLATLGLIVGAWSFLTANNTELIHYPQYFVPAAILTVVTLSPLETLSWILITGGLDECYQYWGLHGGWGIPYDFNDVFMDFLGGALGVVFALAFLKLERREKFALAVKPATAALGGIVAAGVILFATGKLLLYKNDALPYWIALSRKRVPGFWFFDETWGPKTFHTLTPVEGPALLLLALAFYGWMDARWRISAPDPKA